MVSLFIFLDWTASCHAVTQLFWSRRVGIGSIETHLKPTCVQARTILPRSWSRARGRGCCYKNVIEGGI